MSDKVAAIDFGSSKIRCLVAKRKEDSFEIVAKSIIDSAGFNNGSIVNFSEASKSLEKILSNVETSINEKISNLLFNIENESIFSCNLSLNLNKKDTEIKQKKILHELIEKSFYEIKKFNLDKNLLHLFYYVLNKKNLDPKDNLLLASFFYVQINAIISSNNCIKDFLELKKENYKKIKFINSSVALITYFLKEEKKLDENIIIIDIGKNKTNISIFLNNFLITQLFIPVGSNHLTNDLTKVLKIDSNLAEKIKTNYIIDLDKTNNKVEKFIDKKFFEKDNTRKISYDLVDAILVLRIEEIIKLIYMEIKYLKLSIFKTKFYLIGGGSNLKGIECIFKKYFGKNVFKLINTLRDESHLIDRLSCDYIIPYGLLKNYFDILPFEVSLQNIEKTNFLYKVFNFFSK